MGEIEKEQGIPVHTSTAVTVVVALVIPTSYIDAEEFPIVRAGVVTVMVGEPTLVKMFLSVLLDSRKYRRLNRVLESRNRRPRHRLMQYFLQRYSHHPRSAEWHMRSHRMSRHMFFPMPQIRRC